MSRCSCWNGNSFGGSRRRKSNENRVEMSKSIFGEYTIDRQMDGFSAGYFRRKPDVVGFSCYIWNIVYVKELIHHLKKVLPQVRVWMAMRKLRIDAELHLMDELPEVKLTRRRRPLRGWWRRRECGTEVCFRAPRHCTPFGWHRGVSIRPRA